MTVAAVRRRSCAVHLPDALTDVLRQHEVDERLLPVGASRRRCGFRRGSTLGARQRLGRVGHVGQRVEQVAVFGVDHLLHLGQRLLAEALVRQASEQRLVGVGRALGERRIRLDRLAVTVTVGRQRTAITNWRCRPTVDVRFRRFDTE